MLCYVVSFHVVSCRAVLRRVSMSSYVALVRFSASPLFVLHPVVLCYVIFFSITKEVKRSIPGHPLDRRSHSFHKVRTSSIGLGRQKERRWQSGPLNLQWSAAGQSLISRDLDPWHRAL